MKRRILHRIGLVIGLLCYPHEWEEYDRIGDIASDACRWCPKTRTKIRKRNDGRPMPRPTAT